METVRLLFLIFFLSLSKDVSSASLLIRSDINKTLEGEKRNKKQRRNESRKRRQTIRLTGSMETCNKCMGYGMVQNGMSGQPQICKFCWMSTNMLMQQGWTGFDGRYGTVDAAFNRLPADYFDYLDSGDGMEQ